MKKYNSIDAEQELRPQSIKANLPAAWTVSACAALVAVGAVAAAVSGLCSNRTILFVVIGALAAVVILCIATLLSTAGKSIKYEKFTTEAICQRIRGAASGDPEASVDDAYDYQPVDAKVREALDAVLSEINARGTRAENLSTQLSVTSEDRDEYQFRMLGAQMIPGMIKRAIQKIERVAEQRKINDISAFSHNLGDLMDSSLQAAKKPTSLARELGLIRTYLDLDDAITGRRTEYRMSVMCSIVGYKLVPHLILPVVENLLEHSERSKSAKYELAIEINSEPDNMVVLVRDNGRGIDVDTLERIQKCLESNTLDADDDPLSLPSINRRIALCYGDRYGLQVSSSKLGTTVRITLPAKPDPIYAE